jgi:alpha-amylase
MSRLSGGSVRPTGRSAAVQRIRFFSVTAIVSSIAAAGCGAQNDDGLGQPDAAGSDVARDVSVVEDAPAHDVASGDVDARDASATDAPSSPGDATDVFRSDSASLDADADVTSRDGSLPDTRDAEAGLSPPDGSKPDLPPPDAPPSIDAVADTGSDAGTTCPAPFPDETSGVIMEAFYWEPPAGTVSWWKMMEGKACALRKSGITAIWIPPPTKGASSADMGYGVFDRYDLGQYNQKGAVATRWGTRAELESMIAAMHGAGIRVYADMVMNQMMGGTNETFNNSSGSSMTEPTSYDFSARLNVDPSHPYVWDHNKFSGCQTCASTNNCTFPTWMNPPWDFDSSYTNDPNSATYGTLGMYDALNGCEIRYTIDDNQKEMIDWGLWITDALKLDGYRLDAGKHIYPPFLSRWLQEVKGTTRFAVTEFYDGNPAHLAMVIDLWAKQSRLFDFSLHFLLQRMSAGNGSYDMRNLKFGSSDDGTRFLEQHGEFAVTFVDNHDTDNNASTRVANFKTLAYTYILTRSAGYPVVFYKDYFDGNLAPLIDKVIAARNAHGFGTNYDSGESDSDFYVSGRTGDATHKGMLVFLNDGGGTSKTLTSSPFANQQMKEETGASTQTVTTDAQGGGVFPVPARGQAIWVPN